MSTGLSSASSVACHAASTQVTSKPRGSVAKPAGKHTKNPHPWPCTMVPVNVPEPGAAQAVIHPHKDVFVIKVAKVSANGDRRTKMELELVTPKGPEKKVMRRVDTRDTQCEAECTCCCAPTKSKKNKF